MWNQPTEKELAKIPRLYATEDVTFFGFACLNGWTDLAEWGYISFKELKQLKVDAPVSINGQKALIPLEVDRTLYWEPKKAVDVLWIVKCGGIYD